MLLGLILSLARCSSTQEPDSEAEAPFTGVRPSLAAHHVADDAITIDGNVEAAWATTEPVAFDTEWSGAHTTTPTRVRALWSEHALYMLWELDHAFFNVDATRPVSVERIDLFEEDCVEMFLAPDPAERRRYFEIELGPLGHFFDLLIDRRNGTSDEKFSSNAEIKTTVDRVGHKAVIEVALRAPELIAALRPNVQLPMGLFRMEGKAPRQFLAWSPTRTPRPNFHVPDAFGTLGLLPPTPAAPAPEAGSDAGSDATVP
jgi:hypothetical protein